MFELEGGTGKDSTRVGEGKNLMSSEDKWMMFGPGAG